MLTSRDPDFGDEKNALAIDEPGNPARAGSSLTGFYPMGLLRLPETTAEGVDGREILPFRVTLARTEAQLRRAVQIRASSFGRKSLELATILGEPDEVDLSKDAVVLVAEDKATGDCVGTMRIATNLHTPLDIEGLSSLPDYLVGKRIARAERLGVERGKSASLVKVALFKALHRYCLAMQIEWIIVQVTPPRDRDYRALGFEEIMTDTVFESFITPGTRQRCLVFNAETAERLFKSVDHMLYKFMFATWHPDIDIFASVQGEWARPRARSGQAH